jgi:hypothetical protein
MTRKLPGKQVSRRRALRILAGSASAAVGFSRADRAIPSGDSQNHAAQARVGKEVDLAELGRQGIWEGYTGVQWDEPRDVKRVEIEFQEAVQMPPEDIVHLEYWVSSWPPKPAGGWTQTDSPWQGEWRQVVTRTRKQGRTLVFNFMPLTEAENPNAQNAPGFHPSYRRTLKLRLSLTTTPSGDPRLRIYGQSRWNMRAINIQSGCEDQERSAIHATAYNGILLESQPLNADPPGIQLKLLYTEHPPSWDEVHSTEHDPDSNDRTILTIQAGTHSFGVAVDDVIQRKAAYVRPLGIFLGDAAVGEVFTSYMESGNFRPGEDIFSRTSRHPEQTLNQAVSEIPALRFAARSSHPHHPYRYVPLGFPGSREKYGLDFNGNVFVNKGGVKALKEDLARMLWEGDEIRYLIGTGAIPDFREREEGAHQSLQGDYVPLITTRWQSNGVDYEEQSYATMLDAPLEDTALRGDEPSILYLKLVAHNPASNEAQAHVWLYVAPQEHFELTDGMLLGLGNASGRYELKRLRAVLGAGEGDLQLRDLPPGSFYHGTAVSWTATLPGGSSVALHVKIPFRTLVSPKDQEVVRRSRFENRLEETLGYWRSATSRGMQINVPDEEFNRFWRAHLQHVLTTFYRDVPSGYDMLPAATFDYNVFPTETCIQVRLLEMRGLHDLAWRFLRPIVELQGTHPFAGRFRNTSAIFHGTAVDSEHDYTHLGYNFSHGWVLWAIAAYYFYTRDEKRLRKVLPRVRKALEWIIEERKATQLTTVDGTPVPEYGLLPAGEMEDNQEWQYWFGVNAYTYWGLKLAAEAVFAVEPAEGTRLKEEAAAYREDIRNAALRAMAIAPVVPVRDGTFIPYIPPRVYLHGRDLGWFRNALHGAHDLVDCGIFSPGEPVASWIAQDYEENLYMADNALSVPDRDWFSRGGIASLEPCEVYTPIAYLERDEVPQALRTLYGSFAVSYYPDVSAFTEWVSTLGTGGGPFFKTPDEAAWLTMLRLMLIRESGDKLYLNSGAPRPWFMPGRTIEVDRAATFFGEVSFRVNSHAERHVVDARIDMPQRDLPRAVLFRVRHPEGKPMLRVELNRRTWSRFDPARDMISLPATEKHIDITVYFE